MYIPIMKFLQQIREQDVDIHVPVLACSEQDSLAFVLQKLDATHSHRLYIVDAFSRPIKVISLTDILGLCTKD